MDITVEDRTALERAIAVLENPGIAARLVDYVGRPIEAMVSMLPPMWKTIAERATNRALTVALEVAILTLEDRPRSPASDFWHKVSVAATGAGGGAFGLASLPWELPLSTSLMLRSIADIARSEGEDIATMETRLACLEVFALGGRSPEDSAAESGYLAVRTLLARQVSEAAKYLGERGLVEGAPVIVRLLTTIASRFGAVVSDKVAAQAVPLLGAAGGAAVNTIFMDHFQQMARGHFTIRRLERRYGQEEIQRLYAELRPKVAPPEETKGPEWPMGWLKKVFSFS